MRLRRFRSLARAYGGDIRRWPSEVRGAAWRLAREDREAGRLLADERRLDMLLERWTEHASAEPRARLAFAARTIPLRYGRPARRLQLAALWPTALRGTAMAGLVLLAMTAGYSAGASGFGSNPLPHAGRLDLSEVIEGIPGFKGPPAS
ncbi:MAG: hypothetical protein H6923_00980 [Alphaproteobacteria bacterium]|nr:hypothetical protein [Alphaproteobacteria bacterium]